MDIKTLIYLTIIYGGSVFATNYCTITENNYNCNYTIVCENNAGSAPTPSCDDAYVTFIIKDTFIETLTAGFFGSTNFDARVRAIKAIGNKWVNLDKSCLRYYTKTEILDLSDNSVQYIEDYAFRSLINLKKLNLSNNAIETLHTNSLVQYENRPSQLRLLDLSHNKIREIMPDTFYYFVDLQYLYLEHNHIQTLGDSTFGNLKNLAILWLQHNKITSVNMTLVNLKSLKYLDMSHNNIVKLSGYELNRLTSLIGVNMSYNSLESIESNCFNQAFELLSVDFSNNKISSDLENVMFINNVKLKYLNLKNNSITKIQDEMFKHNHLDYINIELNNLTINITENTFTGVSNLTELNLYNQSILSVGVNAFSSMTSLRYLNLSMNKIDYVDDKSFTSTDVLAILDLSHNEISQVHFLKQSLPNLTELYLNNNKLSIITTGTFIDQLLLKKLDVSMNNIVHIEQLSIPLQNLQYLNLAGNFLTGTIKSKTFSPAKYLRYLDISKFNLSAIDKDAFVEMPVLSRLNVSHNALNYIHPDNFKATINLYSLDLSFNNISSFNVSTSSFGSLKAVYLNNNQLKTIPVANFSEILYLDLSHNLISNISVPIIKNMQNLKVIDLSHNQLKSFNNPYINSLKELTDLRLSSNYISFLNLSYFKDLVSLDISNNSIDSINSTFLQNLDYLQAMDISRNNITSLSPGTFQNLKIVKLLNMSSNSLSNLRYGSLRGLHRTEVLDLSKNKIVDLDVHVFHECTELRKLVLDYNQIKELDIEKLIVVTPSVNSISIGGNPIACKEIVRNINKLNRSMIHEVDVTSVDKIYHEDNVHGIRCGDKNYENDTDESAMPESQTSESRSSLVIIVWCTVLSIFFVVGAASFFFYGKRLLDIGTYGVSSSRASSQSIDLTGSDFRGDLLN